MDSAMHPQPAAGGALPFETAVGHLAAAMRGRVIDTSHGEYEERRRIWNATIDRRPRLVTLPHGVADVRAVIAFAREQGLPLSVRGGGHNVAGGAIADGGVVIDLSLMRHVRVDLARNVAEVGGGATIGDVDAETQAFGLATPMGVVSETGVAGLTLHGGMGFLTRRFGLTCDNLVGADVVTADGSLVHASAEHDADLLWALRGGGGNFGVVTRFELALHPVGPEVYMLLVMYPLEDALEVVRAFSEFMQTAPREFSGITVFWTTPDGEPVAPENREKPMVALAGCWSGSVADGERLLAPLRSVATPYVDLSGTFPFLVAQTLFDVEFPPGQRHYWKSLFLDELDDEVIAMVARQAADRPSLMTGIDIWAHFGAVSEEPAGGGAYAQRDKRWLLAYESNWIDASDDDTNTEWTRAAAREAMQYSSGGVYLNFPGSADERDAILEATYRDRLERLRRIKARLDPDNLFRSNINIEPAGISITQPKPGVRSEALRS